MWIQKIVLVLIGLSAGVVVAGGLFSFIVELGVISDFADRTHTGNKIMFYEDMVSAGAVFGNLFQIFGLQMPGGKLFLSVFGLLGGIFVGCWAMALAEILNVFPIFMRRARIVRYLAVFVLMVALGKGFGAGLFFWKRW
ncbi:stage V sporulation protein AB [Blautia sp. MSJ-19]|uniref:stage V sporulation protein AB n=1 Tax=Blautia sp. MSJ-19 TaxID=2841517 RepID=UPI001C0EE567|nr:stage V sporulation protein AB [Blautia sp. MSJ-19]MBU5481197.1 stage V sporulation protein AB [Blautia sp. MSJ-19]